jgi:hypothetical protein
MFVSTIELSACFPCSNATTMIFTSQPTRKVHAKKLSVVEHGCLFHWVANSYSVSSYTNISGFVAW